MRTYTYTYLKFDVESGEFLTFVDTVQAISFEDAEKKVLSECPEGEVLGRLVGKVDEKTGNKTDTEYYFNN